MSRVTLCADDFAYSPGTSRAIAALAHAGRINAVSCMAGMPSWRQDARLLSGLEGRCEIGLHLTLIDERPLSPMPRYAPAGTMPSEPVLIRRYRFHELPLSEIAEETARQFAAFAEATGRAPDFVDSHQHVHHLRGIREIVLEQTARHAPSAWVRSCSDGPIALLARPFAGKAIGSAWHSRGYARLARSFGLATNDSFAGHYDFSPRFASAFPRFFTHPGRHHVIMTHPGAGDRAGDPIAQARLREADFLASDRRPLATHLRLARA